MPRMLENVKNAPIKAIVGAWQHTWPNEPYPGPGIEWRHEAVRWFDHWLKGKDTGILDEPRFAVFVRDWHPPGPFLENAPGKWRYEDGWPIARIRDQVLYPQDNHSLARRRPPRRRISFATCPRSASRAAAPSCGGATSRTTSAARRLQPRLRQRAARGELEILGLPRAMLTVSANASAPTGSCGSPTSRPTARSRRWRARR